MSTILPAKPQAGKLPAGLTFKKPTFAVGCPSVAILGDSGAGKSTSIISLLKTGLKVNVLVTEANGAEVLVDAFEKAYAKDPTLDFNNLRWKQVLPSTVNFKTMLNKARFSNTMGAGDLQKLETGLERDKYPQFMNLIRSCSEFIDDKSGENLGDIALWQDDTAFVLDSQTGVNRMIIQHVCGHRPTMTQPEFGIAQNHIMDLVNMLCSLSCFFIVTAHMEKETIPNTGDQRLMVSTVGKAIAPLYHIPFTEVLQAYRDADGRHWWSNKNPMAQLKRRFLPEGIKIAPDFGPIVEDYRKRKAKAMEEEKANATA